MKPYNPEVATDQRRMQVGKVVAVPTKQNAVAAEMSESAACQ
jgi:hypothetical protein